MRGIAVIEYTEFKNKIIYYFQKYGIEYDGRIIDNFYKFTLFLLSENEKYNLTSICTPDEIITKHYIDSIIVLKYFNIQKNAKIIDIGTGAGFPGLPLYIMRGDLHLTFVDSIGKKISFVKSAVQKTNGDLKNFVFHAGRAEEYGKNPAVREKFDMAVFRAVAKLSVLCEISAPFVSSGKFMIAYKSKNAKNEIAEAQNALYLLDLKIAETIEFDLENENRTLIVIQKSNPTPMKYPRRFSEISKNPL